MGETFELWARPELGDLYAVRRLGGHVTGVCGPIPKDVFSTVDLSCCQYGDPRRAGVRGQDFVPAERWRVGFENQAVILGALARARGSSTGVGERDEDLRLGAAAGALETGSNPGGSRQRGAALTAGAAYPLRGYPRRPHHRAHDRGAGARSAGPVPRRAARPGHQDITCSGRR